MIEAAGILFVTPQRRALFLKRGPDGDHAGSWAFPGGKIEDGETPEEAAVRETDEEAGSCPEGKRVVLARNISGGGTPLLELPAETPEPPIPLPPQVDFTTFLQKVAEPFDVVIDEESAGFAWAPVDDPPQPLHPGARIALARLDADELGIARMMASGELTSPQRYANMTMFDIRITGTGISYRPAKDEHVYRDPANYLTPDFVARCNGLPVIWEHPEKALLNSQEFADRVIGSVFVPYIKGDEVWAIVKIWDDAATQLLTEHRFSTSPNVSFFEIDPARKLARDDGSVVFVEGPASLLDHIAICDIGVWDKGGAPKGVNNGNRSDEMADMDVEADKARKDSEDKARKDSEDKSRKDSDDKLDKLAEMLSGVKNCMDSVASRMDAFEKKEEARDDAARKDAADKARKDSDDKEVERKAEERKDAEDERKKEDEKKAEDERADAARADSVSAKELAAVKARLAAAEAQIAADRAPPSDKDEALLSATQTRADSVFLAFGQRAKAPLKGETPVAYRRRLLSELKGHSKTWGSFDLTGMDAKTLEVAEEQIYADALHASKNRTDIPEGELHEVVRTDEAGRKIREFHGKPRAWMSTFMTTPGRLTAINLKSN